MKYLNEANGSLPDIWKSEKENGKSSEGDEFHVKQQRSKSAVLYEAGRYGTGDVTATFQAAYVKRNNNKNDSSKKEVNKNNNNKKSNKKNDKNDDKLNKKHDENDMKTPTKSIALSVKTTPSFAKLVVEYSHLKFSQKELKAATDIEKPEHRIVNGHQRDMANESPKGQGMY